MSQDESNAEYAAGVVACPVVDCEPNLLNYSENTPSEKPVVAACLPLTGLMCMVETVNEDGVDTSSTYESTLKLLGAETTTRFGDHLAVYITSVPSIKTSSSAQKKHLAAELLGIPVVSPAWVDQCKVTGSRADEGPFIVKGAMRAVPRDAECICCARAAGDSVTAVTEADSGAVAVCTTDTEAELAHRGSPADLTALSVPSPSPRPPQPALARRSASTASLATVPGLPRSHSVDSVPQAVIVLPTFREISPPVVPAEVLEKVQKRRRSERICDLLEEDSDEEFFSSAKRGKGDAEHESWEAVCRISVMQPLPVFYEPGQDGDVLQITPVVLDGGARCSGKGDSSSGSGRRAVSGIKGLTVKGTRDHHGKSSSSSKAGKSSHSGASAGSGGGSKSGSGKGVALVDRHSKAGKTVSKTALSSSRVHPAVDSQEESEPLQQAAGPTAPRTTVVIALTGFDDKSGDRTALVQTLRQFIKRDKRSVAAESATDAPTALDSATVTNGTDITAVTSAHNSAEESAVLAASVQAEEEAEVNPSEAMMAVVVNDDGERSGAEDGDAGAVAACPTAEASGGIGIAGEELLNDADKPSAAMIVDTADAGQATTEVPVQSAAVDSTETAAVGGEDGNDGTLEASAQAALLETTTLAGATPVKRGRGRPPGSTKKHSAGVSSASSSSSGSSKAPSTACATRGASRSNNGSSSASAGNDLNSSITAGAEDPSLVYNNHWRVDPTEASVSLTFDHNDFSSASCTHVIVSSKSKQPRTLRTLFALARGHCILSEDWVHESVRRGAWASIGPFLHPRFQQQLVAGAVGATGAAEGVFRGQKICVLDSVNPPTEVLIDLVRAAGGKVTTSPGEPGVDLVLFGDVGSANDWIETKRKRHKSDSHKEVADARALARENRAVTCQYLFHCIEEGRARAPRLDLEELVTIEHTLVFTCSEKNYEDAVQAVAKAGERQPLSYDAAAKEVNRARSAQKEVNPSKEYWIPSVSRPEGGQSGNADKHRAGSTSSNRLQGAGVRSSNSSSNSRSSGSSVQTTARVKQEPQPERPRDQGVVSLRTSARRSAALAGTDATTSDSAQEHTAAGQSSVPAQDQLAVVNGALSEPPTSGLRGSRGASRRNATAEEVQVVASAPVKAECRPPRLSKAAVLNKHALRDGKGKFKPIRQLRAEAAARAAAQAEVGAGVGTETEAETVVTTMMEVVENGHEGAAEIGEGEVTSGEASAAVELLGEQMVGEATAPEAQQAADITVGLPLVAEAAAEEHPKEAPTTTRLVQEDDDQSIGDHSLTPPAPDQLSEDEDETEGASEGEGAGEGSGLFDASASATPLAGVTREGAFNVTAPSEAVTEGNAPQSELAQGPAQTNDDGLRPLSEQAQRLTDAAEQYIRTGPSPKKRKYGFVDTMAAADLQQPLSYQHHSTSAGAGAEELRGATPAPVPVPVLSNYLAAVTEEESPELLDGGKGAESDLQLDAFSLPLPAPWLLPQVEDAGRVARTVSDASYAVAQDPFSVPVLTVLDTPLPIDPDEVMVKPPRPHSALAGTGIDGAGQQTSPQQQPPRE